MTGTDCNECGWTTTDAVRYLLKKSPYASQGIYQAWLPQCHLLPFPRIRQGLFENLDRSQFRRFHSRENVPMHGKIPHIFSGIREHGSRRHALHGIASAAEAMRAALPLSPHV